MSAVHWIASWIAHHFRRVGGRQGATKWWAKVTSSLKTAKWLHWCLDTKFVKRHYKILKSSKTSFEILTNTHMFSYVMDYKFELWCLWLLISVIPVNYNQFPFVSWHSIISSSVVAVIHNTQNALYCRSLSYMQLASISSLIISKLTSQMLWFYELSLYGKLLYESFSCFFNFVL